MRLLLLFNITLVVSYCQNCRYLYKNNKCFLFLKRKNEIIKIDNKLKYENIESNMYASIQEVRQDNNSCGPNATYYNPVFL